MMRKKCSFSILFAMLLFAGCGETSSEQRPERSWSVPDGIESEDVATKDEAGEAEKRPACAPRVRGFSVESPPKPPSELLEGACRLEKTHSMRNSGYSERTREYDILEEDRRFQVIEHRDGSFQVRRTWTFDRADELVEVEETELAHGDFDRRTRIWEYDDRERIETFRQLEYDRANRDDPVAERVVRRTWQHGSPAEKIVTTRESGEERRVRFEWEHRDGRLARATVRGDTTSRTVVWTYRDGEPKRVRRSLAGEAYERQSWKREDGSLASRDIAYSGSGLSGELDSETWPPQPLLDTAAIPSPAGRSARMSDGRTSPETRPQGENCRPLRSAPGFGHPPDHSAYRLGWRDGDGSGEFASLYRWHAYGGASLFYFSYGHEGAVPGRPPIQKWRHSSERTAVEIEYDGAARPVEIRARTGPHGEEPRLKFVRERRIEDDVLLEDRLEVESESGRQVRTLSFRWDGERLRRRALRVDGRVTERQIWRHPDERTSELELRSRSGNPAEYGSVAPPILPSLDGQNDSKLETIATLLRREDRQGRPVRRVTPQQYRRGLPIITYEYGPHGVSQRNVDRNDEIETTTFEYDARGRKIRKTEESTRESFVPRNVEWTYEGDRLVERRAYTDEGTSLATLERDFQCEN